MAMDSGLVEIFTLLMGVMHGLRWSFFHKELAFCCCVDIQRYKLLFRQHLQHLALCQSLSDGRQFILLFLRDRLDSLFRNIQFDCFIFDASAVDENIFAWLLLWRHCQTCKEMNNVSNAMLISRGGVMLTALFVL